VRSSFELKGSPWIGRIYPIRGAYGAWYGINPRKPILLGALRSRNTKIFILIYPIDNPRKPILSRNTKTLLTLFRIIHSTRIRKSQQPDFKDVLDLFIYVQHLNIFIFPSISSGPKSSAPFTTHSTCHFYDMFFGFNQTECFSQENVYIFPYSNH